MGISRPLILPITKLKTSKNKPYKLHAMLEIIVLVNLGKTIANMVREKGHKPFKFILLMIVLWLGFEFCGSIVGTLIFKESLLVYLFALAGAAVGAFLSYAIAKSASVKDYSIPEDQVTNS